MAEKVPPTLYEWAGGMPTFEHLVNTFYDLTLKDDLLKPFFEHMSDLHIHYVALWLAEVMGGPKEYSNIYGLLKGHPYMIRQHLNAPINEEVRVRWMQLMQKAMDIETLPDDAEFRSAFIAYLEWGTRMDKVFRSGVPVPPESPMPTWGWGERPPYIPV